MRTYLINEDDLKKIVQKAYSAGESWGITYHDWFAPTKEAHEKRQKEALTKVKRSIANRINTK